MRSFLLQRRILFAIVAASVAISQANRSLAQVGALNPNPTMPFDMSRDLGTYGSSSGGMGMGRGPIPPGQRGERNPAETMLKGIEGSNYGRYTGRVVFPPSRANASASVDRRNRVSDYRAAPRGGRPENRWRYRWFQDRWWYLMNDNQWSYFNGDRWTVYQSAGRSPRAKNR